MPKSAQRQFLVKVDGVEGYWARKTGGAISADASKVYDGGALQPENVPGPAQAENITVGRPFDPLRDGPIAAALRQQVGRLTTTVSQTPTDADLVPVADPEVYADALLVGVSSPDSDAASGDAAQIELTFAIGAWV